MRGSYLVRRGETFHLRMRVPAPLVKSIGCIELKLSLYESRHSDALLKASFLAFHIRGFFVYLRRVMHTLSRPEILRLVKSWKAKMIARDSELRRLVETGLSSYSLVGYADACDATSDHLANLADKILPATPDDADRQPLRGDRLADAYGEALALASLPVDDKDPACDWFPVVNQSDLKTFDEVSKRGLVQIWLPNAAKMYSAKASACAEIGSSLLTTEPPQVPSTEPQPKDFVATSVIPKTNSDAATQPTLRDAWERYVSHRRAREPAWRENVPDSARLAWSDFSALIGENIPLKNVDRTICKRYESFANARPRRALTAYRDLSPIELEALDVPQADRLSSSGVAEGLNRITTFFRWCQQEHLIDRNPAEGLQAFLPNEEEDEQTGVQPWSLDEIQILLSPQNLKEFIESHNSSRGTASSQRWTYFPWMIVLGLYTGARLDELGGLRVTDIIERHPESDGRTPVFLVRPNEHRGLKTPQAKRSIPIHPDLERLGLWNLLQHRRDVVNADLLLWSPRRADRVAGKATDDFREYTEQLGLYQPRRKVFHSFRHTFKTRARGVLENGALNSIVGHQANDSTGGIYEHALETPRHKHLEQLSQLNFGLELNQLSKLLALCRSVSPQTSKMVRKASSLSPQ
jgi:integrase